MGRQAVRTSRRKRGKTKSERQYEGKQTDTKEGRKGRIMQIEFQAGIHDAGKHPCRLQFRQGHTCYNLKFGHSSVTPLPFISIFRTATLQFAQKLSP
jgi:hypothetical protein